jgi:hypothetical protein
MLRSLSSARALGLGGLLSSGLSMMAPLFDMLAPKTGMYVIGLAGFTMLCANLFVTLRRESP